MLQVDNKKTVRIPDAHIYECDNVMNAKQIVLLLCKFLNDDWPKKILK